MPLSLRERTTAEQMANAAVDRIARTIRGLRQAMARTQAEMATTLGVSQATYSRFESGHPGTFDVRLACRALTVLGARLDLVLDTPWIEDRRDQIDAAHAKGIGYSSNRLRAIDWTTLTEVSVELGRWRGWIDVLGYHPPSHAMVLEEYKTELLDIGQEQRRLEMYERASWDAARRLGWRPRRLITILALLDTARNDERLRANRALFDTAFPLRSNVLREFLADPRIDVPGRRGVVTIDPRSRGRDWLRPTGLDRRRRPPVYADYADFMRQAARIGDREASRRLRISHSRDASEDASPSVARFTSGSERVGGVR